DGRMVHRHIDVALELPKDPIPGRTLVLPVRLNGVAAGQRFTLTGHLPPLGADAQYLHLEAWGENAAVDATHADTWITFTSLSGDMVHSSLRTLDWDSLTDHHLAGDVDFTIGLELDRWSYTRAPDGGPAVIGDLLVLMVISTDAAAGAASLADVQSRPFPIPADRGLTLPTPDAAATSAHTGVSVPAITATPSLAELPGAWGLAEVGLDLEEELLQRAYPGWARAEPEEYKGNGEGRLFRLSRADGTERWAVTKITCDETGICRYSLTDHAAAPWTPKDGA
ncbi:MAG TPA: hypothetical protein VEI97_10740, partial [bacterium]|nr:hypothetical protein [bacterium]